MTKLMDENTQRILTLGDKGQAKIREQVLRGVSDQWFEHIISRRVRVFVLCTTALKGWAR